MHRSKSRENIYAYQAILKSRTPVYYSHIFLKYGPVRGAESLGNSDNIIIKYCMDDLFLGSIRTIYFIKSKDTDVLSYSSSILNGSSSSDVSRYIIRPNFLHTRLSMYSHIVVLARQKVLCDMKVFYIVEYHCTGTAM